MAKTAERRKARSLRKLGRSLREIEKEVGVSKGTISVWVRDIKLTPQQETDLAENCAIGKPETAMRLNAKKREARKRNSVKIGYRANGFALAKKQKLFAIASALYWGEGKKSANKMLICNTDPDLLRIIKEACETFFPNIPLRFEVVYKRRAKISEEKVKNHWAKELGTEPEKIVAKLSTDPRSSGNLKHPYGIATIYAHSTELVQTLFGGIEHISKRKKPWLTQKR